MSDFDRFASGHRDPQDKLQACAICDGENCGCAIVHGEEVVTEDGWIYHSVDCYLKSNGARIGVYGYDVPAAM